MIPELTFYTAKTSPFSQRVALALAEVKVRSTATLALLAPADALLQAPYKQLEVDLKHKPDCFNSHINTALKVPVLQLGADKAKSTVYLPESLVILELILDLYPNQLLPLSPLSSVPKPANLSIRLPCSQLQATKQIGRAHV